MADQKRTAAELIALFPDNTQGLITAQTARDFVLSTMEVRGAMSGIGVNDVYALTTTPQSFDSYDTVLAESDGISFDEVAGTVTCEPNGDGIYIFSVAVNWLPGSGFPSDEELASVGVDARLNGTPFFTFWQAMMRNHKQTQAVSLAIPLAAGDVVDAQVYTQSGSRSATVEDCTLSAVRIG